MTKAYSVRSFGASALRGPNAFSLNRRFQEWVQADYLDKIVERLLRLYDQIREIDWQWQSADTKLLPAPLSGEKTGPNPTDLGKQGTKRHLLVDGRGVPLAILLTKANRHDLKGFSALLEEKHLTDRPDPEDKTQHLQVDKAYDAEDADELIDDLGYIGHVKRQNRSDEAEATDSTDQKDSETAGIGEPVYPPRRWKVERSISWTNNMRKLRTRWAKTTANYRGLWLLAIALIIYRRIILG